MVVNVPSLPVPGDKVTDNRGFMTRPWRTFLNLLWQRTGGSGDSVAGAAPVGSVSMYAASTEPDGWLFCDGTAISRTTYADLFDIIGTTWGAGDGSTTFNLPDLRGRSPIGVGTGSGLTARALADIGGVETVSLTEAELATHDHTVTDAGHTHGLTDPGHGHTVNDSGHGHAVTDSGHGHSVTDPGHIHSVTDPGHIHSVTDPGHNHAEQSGNFVNDATGTEYVNTAGDKGTVNANTATSTTGVTVDSNATSVTINSNTTGLTVDNNTTGVTVDSNTTGITNATNTTGASINSNTTGLTVDNAGSGDAHQNMMPFSAINYIIRYS